MSQAPDSSSRSTIDDAKVLIVGGIQPMSDMYKDLMNVFAKYGAKESRLMLPDNLGNDPMTSYAFNYLAEAMQADNGYAWSWHCNLAMAFMDGAKVTHEQGNRGAAMFMQFCFKVDVTKFNEWQHMEEQWKQPLPA